MDLLNLQVAQVSSVNFAGGNDTLPQACIRSDTVSDDVVRRRKSGGKMS